MSPDWASNPVPIPFGDIAHPQTLNLYGYAGNNPLSNIDLDGHSTDCGGGGDPSVVCIVTSAWDKVKNWFSGSGGSASSNSSGATQTAPDPQFSVTSRILPNNLGVGVGAGAAIGYGHGHAGQYNLDLMGQRGNSYDDMGPDTSVFATTSGGAAYAGTSASGQGFQTPGSHVWAPFGYAGAGVHFTFGNGSLADIKGPFETVNGNATLFLELGGFSYSYSGSTWQMTVSPPVGGVGWGLEASKYTTTTCLKEGPNQGC